jgi:hypothetical protein
MALGSDGRFYSYNQIAPSTDPGSVVFRGTLRSRRGSQDVDSARTPDGRGGPLGRSSVYELSRGFRRTFKGGRAADRVIETVRSAEIDPPTYFKKEESAPRRNSRQRSSEDPHRVDRGAGTRWNAAASVGLHRKVSYPAMCLVMAFVGLPFSMFVGKRGALFGVGHRPLPGRLLPGGLRLLGGSWALRLSAAHACGVGAEHRVCRTGCAMLVLSLDS